MDQSLVQTVENIVIIATRTLTVRTPDGDRPVEIRVFAPEQRDRDWACRFEIDWPDGMKGRAMYGIDAVQALELTQQIVGVLLYASDAHASGNLFWEKPGDGYGFPVPPNERDLLVGNDKRFFG